MKQPPFLILALGLTAFALGGPAAATEIINSGPKLQVVQGDVARLSAQFFDPDGNGTVTIRALDAADQPVGQINRNNTTGDLEWTFDTTAQDAGLSTLRLTATDGGGATAQVAFALIIRLPSMREKWRQAHFGSGGNAGLAADDADPEGDGHSNLMEFAFGTDPRSGEAMPVYATLGGSEQGASVTDAGAAQEGMQAVFRRRKDYLAAGLNYVVEFSTDLKTWAATANAPTVILDEGEMERVRVAFPTLPPGQARQFFRIRIEESNQ